MDSRHLKELVAIGMIGEGVLATMCPQQYLSLWQTGPSLLRTTAAAFARHPTLTRGLAMLELGLGLWWGMRQFSTEAAGNRRLNV